MTIRQDQTDLRDDLQDLDDLIDELSESYAISHVDEYGLTAQMVESVSLIPLMDEVQILTAKKIIEYYQDASGFLPSEGYANRYWVGDKLNLSRRFTRSGKQATKEVQSSIKDFLSTEKKSVALDKEIKKLIDKGDIQSDLIRKDVLELVKLQETFGEVEIPKRIERTLLNYQELGYGKSELGQAYKKLIKSLKLNDKEKITKAFSELVKAKSGYVAKRISRTEIARAYFEGEIASFSEDEDVVGIKWNLNPKRTWNGYDICDVHANADYGMGKGVFPKDQLPNFPAHPNCACFITQVFDFEVKKDSNFNFVENGNKFISKLPKYKQKELLGVGGQKLFEDGKNWNEIVKTYGKTTIPSDSFSKILKKANN